ncbi:hypothetical protein ASD64_19425 [Mesorhizobium sp. Root157]|uniref:helix-turn-helix domain-containing protein n=1 Tax=Mesorhizobium sp. Root157 TaxID=1736477 RepID=UPI000701B994|nr:helix-turn-helix domain-containing protein [Mesorhizobium sp. Root157]KQZ92272.1 hypothetical protein ASD64_19425 [Mesorhizobium sp. Root157]
MAGNRLMHRHLKVKRNVFRIIEMHLAEKGATEIAKKTGISRSSVYRVISDIMDNQPTPKEAPENLENRLQ